ncbi:glycosyltransferase family 4 protein [Porticoccaceae bacterium]|nr:glycosyltransferase family 4 protein [Porticoccaceae bacterium]
MTAGKGNSICYITTNGIGNAWVAAELKVMAEKGINIDLYSMRRPHQSFFGSDWANKISQQTECLYPLPILSFFFSMVAAPFLFRARFFSGLWNALWSPRENSRARVAGLAHFFVACHWARQIGPKNYQLIHSQWIQSGGTIGFYASWLLDIPFSFTGHAVDLFRDRCALKDKVKHADFIIAISQFHKDFYITEGAIAEKIHIVYCGIDLDEYAYSYSESKDPVIILSFGRLVEKKGYSILIEACGLLRDLGVDFHCEIAGSGPEYGALKKLTASLNLDKWITITGKALNQEEIQEWMKTGDIYAQPCCWSADNDVDGIPRSLMEAMAVGLPSISTTVAGIPDLIKHKKTGLLIAEQDAEGLTKAIKLIMDDPSLRQELSKGGRQLIEQRFNLETCLDPLAEIFSHRSNTTIGNGA